MFSQDAWAEGRTAAASPDSNGGGAAVHPAFAGVAAQLDAMATGRQLERLGLGAEHVHRPDVAAVNVNRCVRRRYLEADAADVGHVTRLRLDRVAAVGLGIRKVE